MHTLGAGGKLEMSDLRSDEYTGGAVLWELLRL